VRDDDPAVSGRGFKIRSMFLAIAAVMLTIGLARAQSLSVGVAVEFVERVSLDSPKPKARLASTNVTVNGTRATSSYSIEIAATPQRELSIYASIADSATGSRLAGLSCEYANSRSAPCDEISLNAVTLAHGTLSLTPLLGEPGDLPDGAAVIDVTIAHH